MTDVAPALEGRTSSEMIAKHLNALHAAWQNYVQMEADERIRRALRSKIRVSEQVFATGDLVFYKREGYDRWLGPAKVVCQDNKIIFVRHGSSLVRVSANRLIKVEDELGKGESSDEPLNFSNKQNDVRKEPNIEEFLDDGGVEGESGGEILGVSGEPFDFEGFQNAEPVSTSGFSGEQEGDQGYKVFATALSKEEQSDMDCLAAKKEELGKLKSFDTYEEVENHGQTCLSTRWVLTMKNGKPKARLVVRGFEEDKAGIVSDSPTVGRTTMRVFLAVVASLGWRVKTTDIKSAFLQGNLMDRVVYVKPPKEANCSRDIVGN